MSNNFYISIIILFHYFTIFNAIRNIIIITYEFHNNNLFILEFRL